MVVVGLKLDLEATREVSRSDIEQLMTGLSGIAGYVEGDPSTLSLPSDGIFLVSAKEHIGAAEALELLQEVATKCPPDREAESSACSFL